MAGFENPDTANASSFYSATYSPQKIIDGNIGTWWVGDTKGAIAWVEGCLNIARRVEIVRLTFRNAELNRAILSVSTDGKNYEIVATMDNIDEIGTMVYDHAIHKTIKCIRVECFPKLTAWANLNIMQMMFETPDNASVVLFKTRLIDASATVDGKTDTVYQGAGKAFIVAANKKLAWTSIAKTPGYNNLSGSYTSPAAKLIGELPLPHVRTDAVMKCGDIDGDNVTTLDDASIASVYVDRANAGDRMDGLTASQLNAMDVDGDGDITIGDADKIRSCAIGITSVCDAFNCAGVAPPATHPVGFDSIPTGATIIVDGEEI